tara:strand:+ start:4906 stop:5325 length:420 start_codon:yes stop_codon:yes gene_type:complete
VGNDNITVGQLGEHICASALLKLGEKCEIVRLGTVDIVVDRGHQGVIRLQVKSSKYKIKDGTGRQKGYQFFTAFGGKKTPLTAEHCDAVAFVASDLERVIFKPISEVELKVTKRIAKAKFLVENLERETWAHTLEEILP